MIDNSYEFCTLLGDKKEFTQDEILNIFNLDVVKNSVRYMHQRRFCYAFNANRDCYLDLNELLLKMIKNNEINVEGYYFSDEFTKFIIDIKNTKKEYELEEPVYGIYQNEPERYINYLNILYLFLEEKGYEVEVNKEFYTPILEDFIARLYVPSRNLFIINENETILEIVSKLIYSKRNTILLFMFEYNAGCTCKKIENGICLTLKLNTSISKLAKYIENLLEESRCAIKGGITFK